MVPTLICLHTKQKLLTDPSYKCQPLSRIYLQFTTTPPPPPPREVSPLILLCLSVCLFSQKYSFHIKVGEVQWKLSRYPGKENPIFLTVSFLTCWAFVLSWNCAFPQIFSSHPAGIPLERNCYCLQFTQRELEMRKGPQVTIQITDSNPNVLKAKVHPFNLLLSDIKLTLTTKRCPEAPETALGRLFNQKPV